MLCQYRRFDANSDEEANEIPEPQSARRSSRRTFRSKSFIDFYDKKEAEIKEMLKRNKRQVDENNDSPSPPYSGNFSFGRND